MFQSKKVLLYYITASLYSILNLYIVSESNNWPSNLTNNFPLKNCLFGTVKLVRNTIKSKFIYNVRGTAFDGAGLWRFDNDSARCIVIFGADKSPFSLLIIEKITF